MKKKNKKFRLKCFYALNYIMATVFILAASCLDGEGWLAEILLIISLAWGWFALAITEMAKEQRGGY